MQIHLAPPFCAFQLYLQCVIGQFARCTQTLKKSCLEIYLIVSFIQGGSLSVLNQTSIYYFVDQVSQNSIKGTTITNFKIAHYSAPVIPVDAGCKRKQNPVSIETKSKFIRLKEWSTASQSRICISSVSKPTISLEKLTKENATGTVPTTLKLSPLKNRDTKIF